MKLYRLAILIAAFAALPLTAADGRIPISSIPYLISVPGHYYLTADLSSAVADLVGIQIATGSVDLDLNGHTLTLSGTGSTYGIFVGGFSTNAYGIAIRNGRIRGAYNAVYLFTPTSGWLSDVRLERLSLLSGASTVLRSTRSGTGIFSNVAIEHCQFFTNDQAAISIQYMQGFRMEASEVRYANGTTNPNIFMQQSSSVEFVNNRITGGLIGLELLSTSGARLIGNTVTGALNAGIHLVSSYGNLIKDNVSTGNGTGILIIGGSANYNAVEGNVMSSNSVAGLSIQTAVGNVYGRNRALYNGPGNSANYSVTANNRSAGDNCDTMVCTF